MKKLTKKTAVTGNDCEAIRRKERSERILVSEGVPINPDLPPFQPAGGIRRRSNKEVAYRALCVLMTAMKAERMDQTMVLRVIRQYGLAARFSPIEKEFIRNAAPTAIEKTEFLWRYESASALLWALGYIRGLSIPNQTCDVGRAVVCMRDRNTDTFIRGAKLRPLSQLLDQAYIIYRYHWSMTDAELNQRNIPAYLKANIVYERRHALHWLISQSHQQWDDLSTDS